MPPASLDSKAGAYSSPADSWVSGTSYPEDTPVTRTLAIVETAKANNLKPFDYVQYLLEEIPKHMDDRDGSFLEVLLPWSEKLPAGIRKA